MIFWVSVFFYTFLAHFFISALISIFSLCASLHPFTLIEVCCFSTFSQALKTPQFHCTEWVFCISFISWFLFLNQRPKFSLYFCGQGLQASFNSRADRLNSRFSQTWETDGFLILQNATLFTFYSIFFVAPCSVYKDELPQLPLLPVMNCSF